MRAVQFQDGLEFHATGALASRYLQVHAPMDGQNLPFELVGNRNFRCHMEALAAKDAHKAMVVHGFRKANANVILHVLAIADDIVREGIVHSTGGFLALKTDVERTQT